MWRIVPVLSSRRNIVWEIERKKKVKKEAYTHAHNKAINDVGDNEH